MAKNNKKPRLLTDKLASRLKKAEKISRIGIIGGIKGRILAFLIAFIFPAFLSLLTFSLVILLLSGAVLVIVHIDPNLKVNLPTDKKKGKESAGTVRKINIPEHLKGKMFYPAGTKLTSKKGLRWGEQHLGIDISGNYGGGTNYIKPIYPGVVDKSFQSTTFGNVVIVKHDVEGTVLYSLNAHLSKRMVNEGDKVDYNSNLGIMGNTGASQGVHLHLELHDANFVYGGSDLRQKTVLLPTDYLYCGEGERLANYHPQDLIKCMDYRKNKLK